MENFNEIIKSRRRNENIFKSLTSSRKLLAYFLRSLFFFAYKWNKRKFLLLWHVGRRIIYITFFLIFMKMHSKLNYLYKHNCNWFSYLCRTQGQRKTLICIFTQGIASPIGKYNEGNCIIAWESFANAIGYSGFELVCSKFWGSNGVWEMWTNLEEPWKVLLNSRPHP